MNGRIDFWSLPSWEAVSALATTLAAFIVWWYTVETRRLRRIADDQLEAQVAPFLMLKSGIAANREEQNSAGHLDRTGGRPGVDIHVVNEGKGVALDGTLQILAGGTTITDWHYELSAIPTGKFITLVVAREDFFGDERAVTADRSFRAKFIAEYRSLAMKKYRTQVGVRGWDQHGDSADRTSLEYERCDEAKQNAGIRLQEIARQGNRVCYVCGNMILKGTPFKTVELERRDAKILRQVRDPDRAPKWRLGLRRTITVTACPYCERKVSPIEWFATGGQGKGAKA